MKRIIFPCLLILLVFTGCKNNSVRISGTLEKPRSGGYLYLDELTSNELITVDSVKLGENGKFSFNRKIKLPAFYLLKVDNSNFLTMLLSPGKKFH